MEKRRAYKAHVIVFPFHGQGHFNPMFQFSKRMALKGAKITIAVNLSMTKTMAEDGTGSIAFEPIYDDITEGGIQGPGGFKGYLDRFAARAQHNLTDLIGKFENSEYPVKCLVYDISLPWALDVAKQLGIAGAPFSPQPCIANAYYYLMYLDFYGKPKPTPAPPSLMSELPELKFPNLPSLGSDAGGCPPIMRHVLSQYDNIHRADWVIIDSFDKLEEEVVNWLSNFWSVRTFGPPVPSVYIDKQVDDDNDNGFHLHKTDNEAYLKWLDAKETGSVVYVAFGSVAELNAEQMAEMAEFFRENSVNFLWVVRPVNQSALPSDFLAETSERGLIVPWCSQVEVLAHPALGCFITHCGGCTVEEAIYFGVPMVSIPQFMDHKLTAHLLEKVRGLGVTAMGNEKGIVTKKEVERCIKEVMHGERGEKIKKNALEWKKMAREAMAEGGSSDKNIDEIIARLAST